VTWKWCSGAEAETMSKLNPAQVFPILIIVLSAAAGIVYLYSGDWRRGLYWLFAAGLGVCVTC